MKKIECVPTILHFCQDVSLCNSDLDLQFTFRAQEFLVAINITLRVKNTQFQWSQEIHKLVQAGCPLCFQIVTVPM